MIDRDHELPITRQAKALGVARRSVYFAPLPVSAEDMKLMRRLDELHLNHPVAGARMLRDLLRRGGVVVGRPHVSTLMKRMGIEAIYRRRNKSKPAPGHKIYPYLLRGVTINRPNQVWATDISYIPMQRGFVYLVAVVAVFTRRVLSNLASMTMKAEFCVEALKEALAR
jgi:putative transposase